MADVSHQRIPGSSGLRDQQLAELVGKAWASGAKGPDAFDCWHLFRHVQRVFFGRDVPDVAVPENVHWAWLIRAFDQHPERHLWRECPPDAMGLVTAADGAAVLMARRDRPAHIGVWIADKRRVLHADPQHGVVFEALVDLRTKGWSRLRFYEPISQ